MIGTWATATPVRRRVTWQGRVNDEMGKAWGSTDGHPVLDVAEMAQADAAFEAGATPEDFACDVVRARRAAMMEKAS